MVWAPHFYVKDCRQCDPRPEWRSSLGCKSQVSEEECRISFNGMKFLRCPRALLREGRPSDRLEAQMAIETYDYRASVDYRTQPAWLLRAWNHVGLQRSAIEGYLVKKAIDEAKAKES